MKSTNEPEAVTTAGQEQKPILEKEIAETAPRWAAIIGLLATVYFMLFFHKGLELAQIGSY